MARTFTPEEKLAQIQESARRRGKSCTITLANVKLLMAEPTCAYTGRRFDGDDYVYSFERIDNDRGYEPGNVLPVSIYANRLRANYTVDELKKLAKTHGYKYAGSVSSANSKINARNVKMENRRKQIAEIEKHIEQDKIAISNLTKELDRAHSQVAEAKREALVYGQIASVLESNDSPGNKFVTRWQLFTMDLKSKLNRFGLKLR